MGFSLDDLGVHPPNRQGIYKFWETYWLTKAAQGGWQAAQLALGKEEATNNVAAYMGVDNQDLFVHELLFDCPDFPAVPEGATTQALMAYPRPYPEFDKAVAQWSAACRARGRDWLTKATIDHDPEAELALAKAYEKEATNVLLSSGGAAFRQKSPEAEQATVWYRKAALDGSREAAQTRSCVRMICGCKDARLRTARQRIRIEGGGYWPDHLRALAQRVEVAEGGKVRIVGSKTNLLQGLAGKSRPKTKLGAVPSFVPKWCTRRDSNPRPQD